MRIIAVDDEHLALLSLGDAIREVAPQAQLACFSVPGKALEYARRHRVDVAFLDVEMQGEDGIVLARKLTQLYADTNIIFVTGFSDYMDEAFELYASGYVKKPVRTKRIERELNNLRYPVPDEPNKIQRIGPFTFDSAGQRVYREGRDVLLTPKENALFRILAEHPGTFYSPETLYERVWDSDPHGDYSTVYVHISGMRRKLFPGSPGLEIEHKRGHGYRFVPPPEKEEST